MNNLKIIISQKIITGIFLCMFSVLGYGQVLIGDMKDDILPTIAPSVALQLESTNKGLKIPTYNNRNTIESNINSPAKGLMVFNLEDHCIMINIGDSSTPDWKCLKFASFNYFRMTKRLLI